MITRREISFNIRLQRKEHAAWRKAAKASGLSLSDWIRSLCDPAATTAASGNGRKGKP